ncbi:MAG: SpoIIE family protein phosphatase [Bacteroidetes bacterium]|nr:SpoIIE family protein phosphatase [Bacteroidota bacterium]
MSQSSYAPDKSDKQLLEQADSLSGVDVEKAFSITGSLLIKAQKSGNVELATEVIKKPLYLRNKKLFLDYAQGKLNQKKLSILDRVYLNHQLMRYYVSVEAEFDQSFTYLMNLRKLLEHKESLVVYPIVIGDAYFIAYWINQIQYDLVRAREYAELLLKHAEKFKLKVLTIKAKMALAELTQHEGNVVEGIQQFKMIEKDLLEFGDSVLLNRTYLLLSNAYTVNQNPDSAFWYAKKAYHIVPVNDAQLKAFSTIHLARGYLSIGEVANAIKIASQALKVEEDLGAKKEIKDIHNLLAEAYKTDKNYKEALAHLEKFLKLDQEQASLLSAANISSLESKMEKEKHQHTLKLKQEEVVVKNAKIKQQNIQNIGLVIVLFFAIGFIVLAVRSYRIKKRDAETIMKQKLMVEQAHQEIKDSIVYAKRIQSAILPPAKLVKEYLKESFILYKPKDVVAGDFYWMETINSDEWRVMSGENPSLNTQDSQLVLFAVADCTGHGVPGAMVSVVCNNALNRSVKEHGLTNPGEILNKTREIVIQEFEKSDEDVKDGMDIALCSLKLSESYATLQYAGANNPLWMIRNGELIETKANKQPIGQFDNPEPYTTHTFELKQGDAIYIFSDGYVDQFGGEKGKKFKATAFRSLLLSIQDKTMEEQKIIINESFETWKGSLEQIDDVCVIGVKI